ncbi:MAG: hypothetical protein L3K09_01010 [Thermoplasmata archaeon]|nr:hypothetical protein [Thermoplasmata archaeon]
MSSDLQSILESSVAPPPPSPDPSGRRRRLRPIDAVLLGVVVVAVIGTAALALTLRSSSSASSAFQFAIATGGCSLSSHSLDVPGGTQAQFGWSTLHETAAFVTVIDPAGQTVYSLNATNGYGSFTSDGGSYTFQAQSCSSDSITFSGSLTASNPD